MRKIIIVVLAILLIVPPVSAKELEPISDLPKWATESCLNNIYKIIQHESGSMQDIEVFEFITEQIIRDIKSIGCNNLTTWRWAIGEYPLSKVTPKVKIAVSNVVLRYPKSNHISCKLIGMKADLPIWASYGYDTTIGFEKTVGKFTVVGAGCRH